MNFGVKRRDVDKVARSYFTGLPMFPPVGTLVRNILGLDFAEAVELSNDPRFLMAVLPAANLIATADELCEFYQLLLDGGTLRGKRIFEPRTVWRATSAQSYYELDFTLGVPLSYGMGFMLGGDYLSMYGLGSPHAFGHLGLTNVLAWADPERHLSVAVMTSGKPVLYPEMFRGIALVHAISSSCPKDDAVPARLLVDAASARGRSRNGRPKSGGRKPATKSKSKSKKKTARRRVSSKPSRSS